MRFLKYYSRVLKDNKGVSAIEFALIGIPFFLALFAVLEIGLIMLSYSIIENSTSITSRTARIGNDGGSGNLVSHIRKEIQENSYGFINSDKIIITSEVADYADIPKPEKCLSQKQHAVGECPEGEPFVDENSNGRYDGNLPKLDLGKPGDRIEITVFYPWKILFPFAGRLFGDENGEYVIKTTSFFQNEEY